MTARSVRNATRAALCWVWKRSSGPVQIKYDMGVYKLVCSLSLLVKTTAYDIRRRSERKHYLFVKAES